MKNIFVIIGHGRCGKSSTVRALTGVYRHASIKLKTEEEEIRISVFPQSAQEAEKSPADVLSDIEKYEEDQNVLIVLRFHPYKVRFSAKDYLEEISKRHQVKEVVFMSSEDSTGYFIHEGVKPNVINRSFSRAINENASMIRRFWNWK